jgi:hypothetical protein
MVAFRYRIEVLTDRAGDAVLEVTLAERWAEDDALVSASDAAPTRLSTGPVP